MSSLKRYLFIWNGGILLVLLSSYGFFIPPFTTVTMAIAFNNYLSILAAVYGFAWFALISFIIVALIINEGRPFKNKGLLIRIPILGALIGYSIHHLGNNLFLFKPTYIFFIQFIVISIILFTLYFDRLKWKLAYRSAFSSWGLALLALLLIIFTNKLEENSVLLYCTFFFIFFSNFFLFQMINFFLVKNYISDLDSNNKNILNSNSNSNSISISILLLISILISTLNLSSCMRFGTLNLREHNYGALPTEIIWIQIAGLQEEHLAMLRFYMPTVFDKTSFESAQCFGKTWTYTLYELRPNAFSSQMVELTGKKNIKDNCNDFNYSPVWKYLTDNGYENAMLEVGVKEDDSFEKALKCGDRGQEFLRDLILWKMTKTEKKGVETFHTQEEKNFSKGKIYYDKSCQQDECYNGLAKNVEYLYENFIKNNNRYFFLVRDVSYLRSLEKKNLEGARDVLLELEKIYKYFLQKIDLKGKVLLLLSSSVPQSFEFPDSGREWIQFEKTGQVNFYHKSSLMGFVLATGARAENFCGIYDEAEIFKRIIEGPKKIKFKSW
ncbi:MAG: hypothetical protein HQK49_10220 [Oligoflexia bacterium]|nr:hypothetical protein [Oligoflexia bacterium]